MTATIRLAEHADLAAVQACAQAAYEVYLPRLGKKPPPMEADFGQSIDDRQLYVLDTGEAIAGFIVLYPRRDHVLIENVAIAPTLQGQGLGSRLILFAEDEARARRLAAIELYTHRKMTENIAYYGSRGYVEIGLGHEQVVDRVYFRKEL